MHKKIYVYLCVNYNLPRLLGYTESFEMRAPYTPYTHVSHTQNRVPEMVPNENKKRKLVEKARDANKLRSECILIYDIR